MCWRIISCVYRSTPWCIRINLDYSCLFSSSCSVNVNGFTSPNPNPSNSIHQSPKLEWRGSEVVYLKERPVMDLCSFDISSHRKGSLYKASTCHLEHLEHGQSVHKRRRSLRASWVPAKTRAAWTHFPNTKWRMHVTFVYLNIHLSCLPSKYFDSSPLCVGIPEGQC